MRPHVPALLVMSSLLGWPGISPAQDPPSATQSASVEASGQPVREILADRLLQAVAKADFNGDGLLDIAWADFLRDTVSVAIRRKGAGFSLSARFAVPGGPRALASGDFDADGATDLAIGTFFGGQVRILPGSGDGSFTFGETLDLGAGLTSLLSRDLDADGVLDLATANAVSGEVLVLAGSGRASFTLRDSIPVGPGVSLVGLDEEKAGSLAAVDLSGTRAWRIEPVSGGPNAVQDDRDVLDALRRPREPKSSDRGVPSASGTGLVKASGDGQIALAGEVPTDPLAARVAGHGVNHQVSFAALDEEVTAFAMVSSDADGLAWCTPPAEPLPTRRLVLASAGRDAEIFGGLAVLGPAQMAARIRASLGSAANAAGEVDALLSAVERDLSNGDVPQAVAHLADAVSLVDRAVADDTDGLGPTETSEWIRRLADQLLLIGQWPMSPEEPLPCDVPIVRDIAVTGDVDRFTFSVATGEVVHLTMASEGGAYRFAPQFRLVNQAGTPVPPCDAWKGTGECDPGPLPASGNPYAVEVRDDTLGETGSYSVHLQRLTAGSRCGETLPCNAALGRNIDARADTDLFEFTAASSEIVHITASGNWRLLSAAGMGVGACATFAPGGRDCGPLPATGSPYAVEVRFDLGSTGGYHVHLQRLTAGNRCGEALPCNTPLARDTEETRDTDLFEFSVTDGEVAHLTVAEESGSYYYTPAWRLLDRTGVAAVGTCGTWTTGNERDCGPLPAVGNPYAVEIAEDDGNGTGSYSLHLQRLTAGARCGDAMPCGVTMVQNIDARADTDLFEFTVAANEVIHMTSTGTWRVVSAAGTGVAQCATFGSGGRDCGPLPISGNPYAIEVRFGFGSTGSYGVHVQRLTAGSRCGESLPCPAPVERDLDTTIDTDLFEFTAPDAEQVRVTVAEVSGTYYFTPAWRLVNRNGALVADCGVWTTTSPKVCGPLPVTGNPYAVEVAEDDGNGTGRFRVGIEYLTSGGCPGVGADLLVTSLGNPPTSAPLKTKFAASDTTCNQGGSAAAASTTGYYLSLDDVMGSGDKLMGKRGVPALAPAACSTGSGTLTVAASTKLGLYYVIACADSAAVVSESSETNNCRVSGTRVNVVAADLLVTAVSNPPASVRVGAGFTATDTVKNQGTADAGPSTTRYYLSLDTKKTKVDIRLETVGGAPAVRAVPALAIGATSSGSVPAVVPAATPPGTYYLIACADDLKKVAESAAWEKNNCKASAATVSVAP